ncbi:hypothetical protein [Lutibacter sp.]|uniref:hypothetical protein n=1 Tax=Lutibacter sp. TaxID=1925666 RepID=UPI002733CA4F|nr:hypothetical protein [Lutibacter sp.]MDP3312860.1 hypothetical protein [Lutibacter sp.]
MKQIKFLVAIALLVSVFAISCKETPKVEEVEAVEEVAVEAIDTMAVDTAAAVEEVVEEVK